MLQSQPAFFPKLRGRVVIVLRDIRGTDSTGTLAYVASNVRRVFGIGIKERILEFQFMGYLLGMGGATAQEVGIKPWPQKLARKGG